MSAGRVIKKDPSHPGAVIVRFTEDNSLFWLPLNKVTHWLQVCTHGRSPVLACAPGWPGNCAMLSNSGVRHLTGQCDHLHVTLFVWAPTGHGQQWSLRHHRGCSSALCRRGVGGPQQLREGSSNPRASGGQHASGIGHRCSCQRTRGAPERSRTLQGGEGSCHTLLQPAVRLLGGCPGSQQQ